MAVNDETCTAKTYSGQSFSNVDHIVNADGQFLFCRYWKPDGDIRALVFHVHGYAEHCGRSIELCEEMKTLGILSFSHDHVGHGESEGYRGYIKDYHIIIRDMWQHIDMMREKYPKIPLFLYGHSMGGGLAVLAANEKPDNVQGMLLSAPLLMVTPETATPVKVFLAKMLSRTFPTLRVGKLDSYTLSRDAGQVKHYVDDPLNDLKGVRAGFGVQLLKLCDDVQRIMPDIKLPFYVAHSEADTVTNIGGSKLLAELAKSEDKTVRFYKEPFHMLEHETADFVKSYFADVLEWLEKRI